MKRFIKFARGLACLAGAALMIYPGVALALGVAVANTGQVYWAFFMAGALLVTAGTFADERKD